MDWNLIIPGCYKDVLDSTGKVIGKDVATLSCIPAVFQNIINGALFFSGVVALFFIIFSGIKLMLSQGDPKQIEGARHTLTYALLGLILILLSFTIINLISYVTNIPCIKSFGFSNCQ